MTSNASNARAAATSPISLASEGPSGTPGCEDLVTQEAVEDLMGPDGGVAIIDFWSPTCGPCGVMAPAYAHVAAELVNEPIRFLKLNTATHPHLAAPFHIRSVPTLLFVINGEIVDVRVGALGAKDLHSKAKWLMSKARGDGFFKRLFGG